MQQGFWVLLKKEIYRFMSIPTQTIVGPVSTALLYQLIFGHQFSALGSQVGNFSYAVFLIPGLIIMQVLQNSFANSSSSLIQAKYTGSVIFIQMAPITAFEMYMAFMIAGIVRGIVVGLAIAIAISGFGVTIPQNSLVLLYFLIMGASIASGIGTVAGVVCDKFDQLSGIQSFVIVPLIYLAGVFIPVDKLSGFWLYAAYLDPFLYIVDGFRYGMIGHASTNLMFGGVFVFLLAVAINITGYLLVKFGVKIKH